MAACEYLDNTGRCESHDTGRARHRKPLRGPARSLPSCKQGTQQLLPRQATYQGKARGVCRIYNLGTGINETVTIGVAHESLASRGLRSLLAPCHGKRDFDGVLAARLGGNKHRAQQTHRRIDAPIEGSHLLWMSRPLHFQRDFDLFRVSDVHVQMPFHEGSRVAICRADSVDGRQENVRRGLEQ